ncbi:MAG: hypothetical protein EB160_09755, partial [Nitrososphaeria archaeon]|nr:hypothetical protein [Nitrososphaeria archaeon]
SETKEVALNLNFETNKGRLPWPVEKGTMSDARYASEQRKAVTKAKKDLLNGVLANWRAHLKSEDNMKKGNATVTAETKAAAMAVAREATGTAIEGDITSGSFAGINLGDPVIDGGTWTFPLTIPEGMKLTGIVKSFKASMSSLLKGGATIQIVGARRETSKTEKLGITGSKLVIYNFDSASSDLIKDNPRKALAEIISGSTVEKPEAPAPRGRPKAPVVAEVMAKEVSDDVDMLAEIEEFDAEKEVDELLKDLDSDVPGDGEKALQILNEYKAEKLKIVDKAIATLDMVLTPDEDAETKVEGDAKTDGEIVAEEEKVAEEVKGLTPDVRNAVKVTADNPFFKNIVTLTRVTPFNNGIYKGVRKIDTLTGLVNEWVAKGEKASARAQEVVGLMQSATAENILPVILLSNHKTEMTSAFLKVIDGNVGNALVEMLDAQKISPTATVTKPVTKLRTFAQQAELLKLADIDVDTDSEISQLMVELQGSIQAAKD